MEGKMRGRRSGKLAMVEREFEKGMARASKRW
jgi:hypothetical protein